MVHPFSKMMQYHATGQLSQHLHTHNLLYPLQSGFRPSHSTQTLLLHCLDKWYKALDTKKYVGAVFLDISKAFDTVSHKFFYPNLPTCYLTSPITPKSLVFLTPTPTQVSFLLGSLRSLSLVPLYFPLSSMNFPLFFLPSQVFSLLMI